MGSTPGEPARRETALREALKELLAAAVEMYDGISEHEWAIHHAEAALAAADKGTA